MLSYLRTSILKSDAQTVVNTVNTVGIMGKGLAAEYRRLFPEMFERYREICASQLLEVGKLWLWKGRSQWVLNFPTKVHWRDPSKIEYVEAGLKKFVETFEERGITEIAFPRLGCGNGGLRWADVRPLMEAYLKPLPIPVYIHDYEVELGAPEHVEMDKLKFRGGSFTEFVADLKVLASKDSGHFQTIFNKSPFYIAFADRELTINRGDKEVQLSESDLQELWSVLNKGILTRKKLGGKLYDEAYYLIAILSTLPYMRPVEIEKLGDSRVLGLEMLKRQTSKASTIDQKFELQG